MMCCNGLLSQARLLEWFWSLVVQWRARPGKVMVQQLDDMVQQLDDVLKLQFCSPFVEDKPIRPSIAHHARVFSSALNICRSKAASSKGPATPVAAILILPSFFLPIPVCGRPPVSTELAEARLHRALLHQHWLTRQPRFGR